MDKSIRLLESPNLETVAEGFIWHIPIEKLPQGGRETVFLTDLAVEQDERDMDDTDRKLLILFSQNPRAGLQEFAKRLGITRQAVHNRIRALEKAGVLKGTYAAVSVRYLDAVPVSIIGRSRASSIDETLNKLGESDLTRRVLVAGGNYIYVIGFLRNLSELDRYAEFVTQTAEMPDPLVGIYNRDEELMVYRVDGSGRHGEGHRELSKLDLRIIASFKDNARRSIADIASEVGASTKTVRHHLEEMLADGSVDFDAPMDLQSAGDLLLVMHLDLKEGADKVVVGKRLLSRGMFRDQYVRTHSNLPRLIIWVFWSDTMPLIREAVRVAGNDMDVRSVMLNFAYIERVYPTWRDKLLEPVTKPQPRDRKPGRRT